MKTLPLSIVQVLFCISICFFITSGCGLLGPDPDPCNDTFEQAQHDALRCCAEAQNSVIEKEFEDIVYLTDKPVIIDEQGEPRDGKIRDIIYEKMDYTVTVESESGPVEVKLYDEYLTCPCDAGVVMFVGNKSVNPSERRGVAEDEDPDDSNAPNRSFPIEYIDPGLDSIPGQDTINDLIGKTVKIAVIDTGIDEDHRYYSRVSIFWDGSGSAIPCLENSTSGGYDFYSRTHDVSDLIGHGTHVSGIIAASAVGKYTPEIMNLKISGDGRLDLFSAICAIRFAVREGVDIINCSWGYYADKPDEPLTRAIQYAQKNGVIVVTAAGNDALNTDECPHWPANYSKYKGFDRVITVASLDEDGDELAQFSNYGPFVQVMAPGYDINSTFLNNSCKELQGTSMAAPQITGLIANLMASGSFADLTSLYANLDDLTCDRGAISADKMMPLDGYSPCNEE